MHFHLWGVSLHALGDYINSVITLHDHTAVVKGGSNRLLRHKDYTKYITNGNGIKTVRIPFKSRPIWARVDCNSWKFAKGGSKLCCIIHSDNKYLSFHCYRSFLQPKTIYKRKPAIGIKLNKLPNLSPVTKKDLETCLKRDSTKGCLNVPRNFLQEGTSTVS